MDRNEILKELKEIRKKQGGLYDFIASYYWQMDKEDLKDMLLEVLANIDNGEYHKCIDELASWLKEYKSWDEEG